MSAKDDIFVKGCRVWIPDFSRVWRCAQLLENYSNNRLSLQCDDGEVKELHIKCDEDLPPLRNPDILIGENDLTSLSYLHEPAVLYNLQVRFSDQNVIYTYCGIVLVAINPYNELQIYGADTISAYRGQAMGDLEPHIFAVAEEAFTKMERENRDQSIIVSGESGAGKTVSAKYAMRYFATVGGSSDETLIEKKILASNPIMEAMGNAKTTRNDNSSRFGKFIELHFTKKFHIMGANMRTYLLEKSRVVFQASEERNYHMFYQLCAASSGDKKLSHLRLAHQDTFHYLNQGESPDIEGINDAEDFVETCKAFSLLSIGEGKQQQIFKILASVLHMGNVQILEGNGDSCVIEKNDESLSTVAELLQANEQDLKMWLCNRKIVSGREVFTKPMTIDEAVFSRDALAKHIYAKLFEWIVTEINKCFASPAAAFRFIGVLDIYGFETFQVNSFEQFCINYANEKLQQQFNQHVFKLEQEEYIKENIEWEFINFYDNQPCIDLIESKLGVLDLLDEECKMPKGSDQSWVEKIYDKCKKWEQFNKPRLSNTAFLISHFADQVTYESYGFLEKNRDTVSEECLHILQRSQLSLVKEIFSDSKSHSLGPSKRIKVAPTTPSKGKQAKKTVGSQFRDSLSLLMNTLNSTTPHYVRCIKPNDNKQAFTFEPCRATQQLRACGVLETVRISAAGYPSRWTYLEFFNRYRVLCKSADIRRDDMKTTCEKILANLIKDEDKFKFGRSKIFFRAGQVAYMEKLRADRLRACGIMIQKHVRGFLDRRRYHRMRKAALLIQKLIRGYLARRRVFHVRRLYAVIKIQAAVRGFVKRLQYKKLVYTVTQLQSYARGAWARERCYQLRRYKAAVLIQKNVRRYQAIQRYRRISRGILGAQGLVRCFLARKVLKKLKVEAKSVEHQKKLNKGLENKIISLQQKLTVARNDNVTMASMKEEIAVLKARVAEIKPLESKLKTNTIMNSQLTAQVEEISKNLEDERGEKMDIVNEKDRNNKENNEIIEKLNADNIRLSAMLSENEKNAVQVEGEANMKKRFESEKQLLLMEYDEEKTAYQRLLLEYKNLEQKYENLSDEVIGRDKNHKRTPSSLSNVSGISDATTELARDDLSEGHSIIADDDIGYGSVRSHLNRNGSVRMDNVDWESTKYTERSFPVPEKRMEDVSLVLQLQTKLRELGRDRRALNKKLELYEGSSLPIDDPQYIQEMIRLQELEMENAKLKTDLFNLRKAVADEEYPEIKANEFMRQFENLHDELQRRREESIQMRTVLANRASEMKVPQPSLSEKDRGINEDGELTLTLQSQKQINSRQLLDEVNYQKTKHQETEADFKAELARLRKDNQRQQEVIGRALVKDDVSGNTGHSEELLQSEVMRLTSENLDMQGKMDVLEDQLKKYKRTLKAYARKLKEVGDDVPTVLLDPVVGEGGDMPVIRKKAREYMGMFEYDRREEDQVIRMLIYELKPRVAVTLLPGLPAYILFMCIRHIDHVNEAEKVRSLLNSLVNGLKRVIKKRSDDLDSTVLWLSNTLRLLHTLKQYSGEKTYQAENTDKQNEQSLRNFDLSEYRAVFSDVGVWIYNAVINIMEKKIQPLIIPAILENETIPGISGNKPGGMRGRQGSVQHNCDSPMEAQKILADLISVLTHFYRTLAMFGTDPQIITQIFKQIFYFICAGALNNLLLRKDMCHWSRGLQIRYNLSLLEQWTRDMRLQEAGVTVTLAPIIQASQLLQARKTESDVDAICELCEKLTISQIIKILNLYTPADDYEERVSISFINQVQAKLMKRTDGENTQAVLLMNTKMAFPVRFSFNPSSIRLEDIELPDVLALKFLKKV